MKKFHQLELQLSRLSLQRSFWLPSSHPGCPPLLCGPATFSKDQTFCWSQALQAPLLIQFALSPSTVSSSLASHSGLITLQSLTAYNVKKIFAVKFQKMILQIGLQMSDLTYFSKYLGHLPLDYSFLVWLCQCGSRVLEITLTCTIGPAGFACVVNQFFMSVSFMII